MATPSEARAQYRIDALPEHAGRVVVVAPSVLALLGATLCDFVWLSTAEARSLAKLAVAPRRAAGSGPSDVAVAVGRAVIDELMAVAGVTKVSLQCVPATTLRRWSGIDLTPSVCTEVPPTAEEAWFELSCDVPRVVHAWRSDCRCGGVLLPRNQHHELFRSSGTAMPCSVRCHDGGEGGDDSSVSEASEDGLQGWGIADEGTRVRVLPHVPAPLVAAFDADVDADADAAGASQLLGELLASHLASHLASQRSPRARGTSRPTSGSADDALAAGRAMDLPLDVGKPARLLLGGSRGVGKTAMALRHCARLGLPVFRLSRAGTRTSLGTTRAPGGVMTPPFCAQDPQSTSPSMSMCA